MKNNSPTQQTKRPDDHRISVATVLPRPPFEDAPQGVIALEIVLTVDAFDAIALRELVLDGDPVRVWDRTSKGWWWAGSATMGTWATPEPLSASETGATVAARI